MGTKDHAGSPRLEDRQREAAPAHPQPPAVLSDLTEAAPYYLLHFQSVLAEVQQHYGFLLAPAEIAYIERLGALPLPARMLYARLANRKGPLFRLDRLRYPEIPDLAPALRALSAAGFIEYADDRTEPTQLLGCFTLGEIAAELPASLRRGRRPDLIAALLVWEGLGPLLARLRLRHPLVRLSPGDPWPFLRYLFFGELRDNLSDFVVRDLGYVRPEEIAAEHRIARFASREEAEDAYRMACRYDRFRAIRDRLPAIEVLRWWQGEAVERNRLQAGTALHDRLIERLGQRLEKAGEQAAAIALYRCSPEPGAQERLVRLLLKQGERAEAERLLRRLADGAQAAEARYRAGEMLARLDGARRASTAWAWQKSAGRLTLPAYEGAVELAVLAHYRTLGWSGLHAENWLWAAAFGLLFWDIVYDGRSGAFHSPLQCAPSDLYEPSFYARRQAAIEARLAALADPAFGQRRCAETFAAKAGLANPFLAWETESLATVSILLARLPASGLQRVLRRMAEDLRHHMSGFPDLFLWSKNDYAFVEVKSERDRLSPKQYQWLGVFSEAGLKVRLENIRVLPAPLSPERFAESARHP
ncbi:VRR-NUC domain-containing protein [Acidisoma sp. C75]